MDELFLAGRILLGGVFFMFGLNHFSQFDAMSSFALAKGVPFPRSGVALGGAALILGGTSLAFGVYPTVGIWMLVGFLVPTTVIIHNFWAIPDLANRTIETVNFYKNLGLLGGVLSLLQVPQPWPYSLMAVL